MSQLVFLVNIPRVYQTHRPAQLRRWYRPPPKLRPTSKRKLPNPTDAQLHASGPSRLESVIGELVARASHKHALFRDDKASVYHYLEEATRTTAYAASIKLFQRRKDGRGAWLALHGQYAGKDKWEAEIKFQGAVQSRGLSLVRLRNFDRLDACKILRSRQKNTQAGYIDKFRAPRVVRANGYSKHKALMLDDLLNQQFTLV
jgi:hypothetical protein